jgi:ribonucleoside-diphosphate reductase alpha chain
VANAIECLGFPYGSPEFLKELEQILSVLRDTAYTSSVSLALEKGTFSKYDGRLLESEFATTLPQSIRDLIKANGLRNSHLLSIAPTGTISLSADNISSGIEPVFSLGYTRTIQTFDGSRVVDVTDYAHREWGIEGKTADKVSVEEHVDVLTTASRYVDSACSKTCNVSNDVTWEEFKNVYMRAYEGGASGCTTFRAAGKRFGVLNAAADEEEVVVDGEEDRNPTEGSACYYDPETGIRSCE